jgi:hypothetical protein
MNSGPRCAGILGVRPARSEGSRLWFGRGGSRVWVRSDGRLRRGSGDVRAECGRSARRVWGGCGDCRNVKVDTFGPIRPSRFYVSAGAMLEFSLVRASGGIGRRAGFRCQWPQGRGGSSPPSRTANEKPLTGTCRRFGEGLLRVCVGSSNRGRRGGARCPRGPEIPCPSRIPAPSFKAKRVIQAAASFKGKLVVQAHERANNARSRRSADIEPCNSRYPRCALNEVRPRLRFRRARSGGRRP